MKKLKKKAPTKTIVAVALATMLVAGTGVSAWADSDQWKQDRSGWWYQRSDGSYPTSSWEKINGQWYHFNSNGYMQTGWQKIGGAWYYLRSSGVMVTGWNKVGSTWYYHRSSGAMTAGWQKIGGSWYYFKSDGSMVTGWNKVGGLWYYHNGSGAMLTGWQKIGGSWYLLGSNGSMKTGWQKVGNNWYYLNSSGVMAANTWVGNYWLESTGIMATNTWVDGEKYYVGENGIWNSKQPQPTERELLAVRTAKSALQDVHHPGGWSRAELIYLLEDNQEGAHVGEEMIKFSHDEAVYGVDHAGADWNEQAVKSAQLSLEMLYADERGFSPEDVIELLEHWEFTHEEAMYALNHIGPVDWNKQALKAAEWSIKEWVLSPNALISELEVQGFTHDQAIYGATNVNVNWDEQAVNVAVQLQNDSADGWSRTNMVAYLESSGFTHEQVVYAVDHAGVNWNE